MSKIPSPGVLARHRVTAILTPRPKQYFQHRVLIQSFDPSVLTRKLTSLSLGLGDTLKHRTAKVMSYVFSNWDGINNVVSAHLSLSSGFPLSGSATPLGSSGYTERPHGKSFYLVLCICCQADEGMVPSHNPRPPHASIHPVISVHSAAEKNLPFCALSTPQSWVMGRINSCFVLLSFEVIYSNIINKQKRDQHAGIFNFA